MPPLLPTAPPTRQTFDPYNSSSTGHQRANNCLAGSTSWRASRTLKLGHQFRARAGGGKRVFDTVGAGSEDFGRDGRKENGGWEKGAKGLRTGGERDVREYFGGQVKKRKIGDTQGRQEEKFLGDVEGVKVEALQNSEDVSNTETETTQPPCPAPAPKQIFQNTIIYINGSTAPLISDHKLKHLLAAHGARLSIALGRRSVTHVILGTPNGCAREGERGGQGKGAGGGLAAGKIQKEILRVGGCGVRYVGVDWVLESIKAGKRLPEVRFSNLSTAAQGQKSVYGMFKKEKSAGDDERR